MRQSNTAVPELWLVELGEGVQWKETYLQELRK